MTPTLHHGDLPLIIRGPDEMEGDDGELDAVSLTILLNTAGTAWRTALATAGYARKTKLTAYTSMWVRSVSKTQTSDITTEVSVEAIGLLVSGDKRRRVLGVAGREVVVGPQERLIIITEDRQGLDPETDDEVPVKRRVPKLNALGEPVLRTIVTPSGSAKKWSIKDAFLTVADTYFVTTAPSTTVIGTAQTPPNAPTPPTSPWGSFAEEPLAIHPNGWVLDDRRVVQYFDNGTAGLWEVSDLYGFYYALVPG